MLRVYPSSVSNVNNKQQYPLHTAAQSGAAPSIIKSLTDAFIDAADHPDIDGKTPLHLACQHYASAYRPTKHLDGSLVSLQDAMVESIQLLNRPAVVNMEDEEGMTALEYAIDTNADLRIIKNMQRACEQSWREKR